MEDGAVSPRILVVEDDTDLRETLWRALSREGYQVSQAGDGTEALSALRMRARQLVFVEQSEAHAAACYTRPAVDRGDPCDRHHRVW